MKKKYGKIDSQIAEEEQTGKTISNSKEKKKLEAELRQKKYNLTKPLRKKIESVEKEIESYEQLKKEIETKMLMPDYYKDSEKVKATSKEYEISKEKLENLYLLWDKYNEELVEIENSIK
jgi:ATP-binding cassette subfamily F protein 3